MKRVSRFNPSPLWISIHIFIIIAIMLSSGYYQPTPTKAASPSPVFVDPIAEYIIKRDGSAQVKVVLREQADLSGAVLLDSKSEKGQFVYDTLIETANRTQGPLQALLESRKVEFKSYWIENMIILSADSSLLQILSKHPDVDHIEYLYPVLPDPVEEFVTYGPSQNEGLDGGEAIEWNITRVGAPDVWNLGITGQGVVVADLDTGVQWDHPALINQYRGNLGGGNYDHNYNWFDGGMTTMPTDYDTHGTHTMGTAIGSDLPFDPNNAANGVGMAPGAKWIACPGIGSPYVGTFDCFQFFMAPTDLLGNNPDPSLAAHVINNSWSSAGTNYHPAIQALTAAGIFFAKSAGNTGSGCSTITNPGQWPEVTATAAFAQGDTIASFSSRGPVQIGYDTFVKPDIAAPGVAIRSTLPGNTYGSMQGTSMASPHITGAVALIIAANPVLAGNIDLIQMILKTTAEPKISAQCGPFVDVPNAVWGYGILDIHAAVLMAQEIELGQIDGTVIDEGSMDPIPGANITFEDESTGWILNDISAENGEYDHELAAASYTVTASAYGYLPEVVTGVAVTAGVTTTQALFLETAPLWVVSGTVTEEGTGDPLAAEIIFADTPIFTNTDPTSGEYSTGVAQGTYWMKVTSPGHTAEVAEITIDENLVLDYELTPIHNYYMRTADSTCSPAEFNWLDATNGTLRNLSDDASVFVSLPVGTSFTFYGQTYTNLYVVSNGIIVFGTNNTKWSGPIPDPATPNNGVYAFSTDLNPSSGAQGSIYTDYINDRYFVIEWLEVEHFPSGDPETFEIVLDLQTGQISIQYLTVSNPADAVAGVENATGMEATQYAYGLENPELFADNVAVDFYPTFSTPPMDAYGEVTGTLYDAVTSEPILGSSLVTAVSGTDVYTVTPTAGVYTLDLCPAEYGINAEADEYTPSDIVPVVVSGADSQVLDFYLEPLAAPEYFLYLPLAVR